MLALTLFTLAPEVSVEEYREYSRAVVRPTMLAMPSVQAFRDAVVRETYDGAAPSARLVEVIEITDPAAFRHDNETGAGARLAEEWTARCSSFEVLFCDYIA